MKRLCALTALSILLFGSLLAFADGDPPVRTDQPIAAEQAKTAPPGSDQTPSEQAAHSRSKPDPAKYELGSIRILVYETVRKPADRAVIYINDEKKGNSPVFQEGLKPGEYLVRVAAPKATWAGNVTVEPGKTAGVDVTVDKGKASAELYEVLLWEDFLDNRNNWDLKPGSTIANGSLVAKTDKVLEYYNELSHAFQDFSMEANFRVKQVDSRMQAPVSYNAPAEKLPDAVFGFVFRVKGTATVLLFASAGGAIDRYYLVTFDDLEFFSRPLVLSGDIKAVIGERFRIKTVLRHEELQIFIDGKLVAITQVKYTNEGNIGLAIGPGLKVEVDNVTIGKV